jgi:hypothetical protein
VWLGHGASNELCRAIARSDFFSIGNETHTAGALRLNETRQTMQRDRDRYAIRWGFGSRNGDAHAARTAHTRTDPSTTTTTRSIYFLSAPFSRRSTQRRIAARAGRLVFGFFDLRAVIPVAPHWRPHFFGAHSPRRPAEMGSALCVESVCVCANLPDLIQLCPSNKGRVEQSFSLLLLPDIRYHGEIKFWLSEVEQGISHNDLYFPTPLVKRQKPLFSFILKSLSLAQQI